MLLAEKNKKMLRGSAICVLQGKGICLSCLACFLCWRGMHRLRPPPTGGLAISDNGTHIDRGILYINSPFLTASGGTAPYTFSAITGLPTASADFDTQRWIVSDAMAVNGNRAGSGMFAAIVATATANVNAFDLSSYLRTDLMATRLNGYQETGGSTLTLAYDSATQHTSVFTLGSTIAYPMDVGIGQLAPNLRVEFQTHRYSDLSQGMHYADEPNGTRYTMFQPSSTRALPRSAPACGS